MYGKRRSIRLEGYDYFRNGLYFVTIDLESKKNLFWKEINKFELNEMGMLAEKCWLDLEMRFNIKLDEYVIMPNHIHGILRINRATTRVARTLNSNVGAGFMPARDVNIN
ncbi:MAG TPA: transposase, partial [Candidatus Woesebacteria bacterium]|nr:transposase [Candidatus Woesebacteria bacterium]